MYITGLDRVEKTIPQMEGAERVYKQIPLGGKDGAPVFSFRVFTIMPGGHTPFHTHPYEHMNYVIEGKGVLVTEGKEYPINEGDFVLVLPGEKHQYKNSLEDRELRIICAVPKEFE